jgi:hypothetical protein
MAVGGNGYGTISSSLLPPAFPTTTMAESMPGGVSYPSLVPITLRELKQLTDILPFVGVFHLVLGLGGSLNRED